MPSTRGAGPAAAPKPPPPASTPSTSSLSSSRQDRNARTTTVQKSATPHSQSSEEMSEPPRRSQRSHQPKKEELVKDGKEVEEEAVEDGDEEEEEEITRCICGQQEYPGPPLSEAFDSVDLPSEDTGGLFISCDGCSVWQHGGCVGILEDSQVPDKYFCEECRPKLHELHTDSRGQKYSLYQPVYGKSNRKSSVSKHGDKAQRERELSAMRASADPATGRRRATMRSKEHDDEEEQIRRAIEESKRAIEGAARRNGKRGRDESDENKQDTKRQRRTSEAAALSSKTPVIEDESDDEPTTMAKGKKAKTDVGQSTRLVEQQEKEKERERARAEAAGRRQERAGRRRVDEDPADETPNPTSAKASPPPSSQPESPQPSGAVEKISHKKGAGRKTKKLGNNQYTKLRGAAPSSPPNGKKSQNGTSSGDEPMANGELSHKGSGTGTKNSPERGAIVKGKFGKGKHKGLNGNGAHKLEEPSELTLATMKRRTDAMAAFIAKAQAELSGDRTPNGTGDALMLGAPGGPVQPPTSEPSKSYDEMTALEMAAVVQRSIAAWQHKYANGGAAASS